MRAAIRNPSQFCFSVALLCAFCLAAAPRQARAAQSAASPKPQAIAAAEGDGTAAIRRLIGLDEVLELAGSDNIDLRRAGATHRIAEGRASEAKLAWVPELEASAGFSKTDGQVQGSFGAFRDVNFQTTEPFGRLAYELNPAEVLFRVRAADDRAAQAEAHTHAVRNTTLTRAAIAYYDLVFARAARAVAVQARNDGGELVRIADLLVHQGSGRGDDVQRARAELAGAQQRVASAQNRLETASIRLAVMLDLDPTVQLSPAESAPAKVTLVQDAGNVGALVQRALHARPEPRQAQNLLSALRADRRAAIARLASPTLQAYYQEGATGTTYNDLNGLSQYGVVASWTLSASQLAGVGTARAREREARLATRALEQRVASQVAGAAAAVKAAQARIEPAQQALHAANETARIVRVRFEHGRSLAIEVIDAQKLAEQARLDSIEAVVDYDQAQLKLRSALGEVEAVDLGAAASRKAPQGNG